MSSMDGSTTAQELSSTGHEEHRDDTGAKLGMWLFLFTELMLFGVLFIIYAVYRAEYSRDFHHAAQQLDVALGSFNTFVLLTSSLTMVLSISALQKKDKDLSICFLLSTICLGLLFMVNKFFEWNAKISHGIYPSSDHLAEMPHGEQIFYGLYFIMTGLHGLHVVAGVVLLSVMLLFLARDKITSERFVMLENSGLYWHLVDLVWIFLLPLFYLTT
ncbi:cytochrome c oxidase subunit 3 family protein [Oligoflexia bacterium]|nr:cytochrome c oxidase subunit 3 family protein [Oligoflexia bacterium]